MAVNCENLLRWFVDNAKIVRWESSVVLEDFPESVTIDNWGRCLGGKVEMITPGAGTRLEKDRADYLRKFELRNARSVKMARVIVITQDGRKESFSDWVNNEWVGKELEMDVVVPFFAVPFKNVRVEIVWYDKDEVPELSFEVIRVDGNATSEEDKHKGINRLGIQYAMLIPQATQEGRIFNSQGWIMNGEVGLADYSVPDGCGFGGILFDRRDFIPRGNVDSGIVDFKMKMGEDTDEIRKKLERVWRIIALVCGDNLEFYCSRRTADEIMGFLDSYRISYSAEVRLVPSPSDILDSMRKIAVAEEEFKKNIMNSVLSS